MHMLLAAAWCNKLPFFQKTNHSAYYPLPIDTYARSVTALTYISVESDNIPKSDGTKHVRQADPFGVTCT